MKKIGLALFSLVFGLNSFAQAKQGHTNQNKFKQLKQELPTPNLERTASGKPGKAYTQQKVDYVMDITLDDANTKITGCLLYTSPSPRDGLLSRMPSSA